MDLGAILVTVVLGPVFVIAPFVVNDWLTPGSGDGNLLFIALLFCVYIGIFGVVVLFVLLGFSWVFETSLGVVSQIFVGLYSMVIGYSILVNACVVVSKR